MIAMGVNLSFQDAHKVFANADGVDGTGNNAPISRHTISSSRTARDSLRVISSQARLLRTPAEITSYNRNWLKNSAYRFEWSVSNASRK